MTAYYFWCNGVRRAKSIIETLPSIVCSKSEVAKLEDVLFYGHSHPSQQNVFAFDVSVYDFLLVHVYESGQHMTCNDGRRRLVKGTLVGSFVLYNGIEKISASTILENESDRLRLIEEFEKLNDMLMFHLHVGFHLTILSKKELHVVRLQPCLAYYFCRTFLFATLGIAVCFEVPIGPATYEFGVRTRNSEGWSDYLYEEFAATAFRVRRRVEQVAERGRHGDGGQSGGEAFGSEARTRARSLRGSTPKV